MNIVEILKHLNIPFCKANEHHHVRQGWVGLDCPWCLKPRGGKGKWKLGIEISSGRTNCWGCGPHGLNQAIALCANVSLTEVYALTGNLTLPKHVSERKRGVLKVPTGIGPLSWAHRNYLVSRGLDPDEIEALWGVQGIEIASKLSWRLFIPVTLDCEMVSWTTRSISPQGGYISASPEEESRPLKSTVYGADLVRNVAIVVEGPGDAWRVGPGAIATFGVVVTPAQISIIAQFPLRVICFDNEPRAQIAADRLCQKLSCLPGQTVKAILDAPDPGSATKREIELLREMYL